MSNFSEPSVTLCGAKAETRHAVCVRPVDAEGNHIPAGPYTAEQLERAPVLARLMEPGHRYCPVSEVERALATTGTPCQWYGRRQ